MQTLCPHCSDYSKAKFNKCKKCGKVRGRACPTKGCRCRKFGFKLKGENK